MFRADGLVLMSCPPPHPMKSLNWASPPYFKSGDIWAVWRNPAEVVEMLLFSWIRVISCRWKIWYQYLTPLLRFVLSLKLTDNQQTNDLDIILFLHIQEWNDHWSGKSGQRPATTGWIVRTEKGTTHRYVKQFCQGTIRWQFWWFPSSARPASLHFRVRF